MSIVFLCPTGTYASLVVANLWIGNLNPNNSSPKDILNLPYFGEYTQKQGIFLYIGNDSEGNMVYTLGASNEAQLIKKSAYDLVKITKYNPDDLLFYDVSKFIPGYLWYLCKLNIIFPKFCRKVLAHKLYRNLSALGKMIKKHQAGH